MSKLSEKHLREGKVERLKAKILNEIECEKVMCIQSLKMLLQNNNMDNNDYFDLVVNKYFCVMQLKRFVELPDIFMEYYRSSTKHDFIIYMIDDETIDIWLQDDYNFTLNYLSLTLNDPLSLYDVLDEQFLGITFTSFFDQIRYKNRLEEVKT